MPSCSAPPRKTAAATGLLRFANAQGRWALYDTQLPLRTFETYSDVKKLYCNAVVGMLTLKSVGDGEDDFGEVDEFRELSPAQPRQRGAASADALVCLRSAREEAIRRSNECTPRVSNAQTEADESLFSFERAFERSNECTPLSPISRHSRHRAPNRR
eukprot:TRINITY_DN7321_c0_g2_i2.p1 TRINITY_DN7321_c0_g2~~TRINITY_DN7321_c0_g2_i2.p1  ORF type:complete len:158 (+),score=11.52 TRINITY_DN7321_c0_g2_i2:311-784(+)